jgi:hypothetical protein
VQYAVAGPALFILGLLGALLLLLIIMLVLVALYSPCRSRRLVAEKILNRLLDALARLSL